jgi:hypothetical protein
VVGGLSMSEKRVLHLAVISERIRKEINSMVTCTGSFS